MTTSVLLVAHGGYGASLIRAAEDLVGPLELNLCEVLWQEAPDEICSKLERVMGEQREGVLVLTDLIGSTPVNVCFSLLAKRKGSEIITGLNLAMLIKLSTCDRDLDACALALELRQSSQQAIQLGSDVLGKGEPHGD